jgi:hypothetical protein
MQQAITDVAQAGDPAANLGAALINLFNFLNFRHGGSLDAQSYGPCELRMRNSRKPVTNLSRDGHGFAVRRPLES